MFETRGLLLEAHYSRGRGETRPKEGKIGREISHTSKQLESFLGLAGYHRIFVPKFSKISAPIT
jgi:hypothetical protein